MTDFATWQTIVGIIGLVVIGGGVLLLGLATLLAPPQGQLDAIEELTRYAAQYRHLHDPMYQHHLLWRHRISYHAAFQHQRTGALTLPAYPMSIPIERWRAQCCRVLEDRELRTSMEQFDPQTVAVYRVMWRLCCEAEKIVARPSSLHDHLAVMDAQLTQLNAIHAKARQLEATICADTTLTEQEQKTQCVWIQDLAQQRINALLEEEDRGTNKDEIISPE
jgi:hypothetical protein